MIRSSEGRKVLQREKVDIYAVKKQVDLLKLTEIKTIGRSALYMGNKYLLQNKQINIAQHSISFYE